MLPWWILPLILDLLIVFVAGTCFQARDMPYRGLCSAGILIVGLVATIPIWGVCALLSFFL